MDQAVIELNTSLRKQRRQLPVVPLHATEIVSNHNPKWCDRGCTAQQIIHLDCKSNNFNTHVCSFWTAPWLWPYIFVSFWYPDTEKTHISHKGIDKLLCTKQGLSSVPPDWDSTANCQLSNTFVSCHRNCVKITISISWPRLNYITYNPLS